MTCVPRYERLETLETGHYDWLSVGRRNEP